MRRGVAAVKEILELERANRHVIDDEVGHDVAASPEGGDIAPRTEPGVDVEMVFWVKPGVRAVKRPVEREHMNAREDAVQRSL